MSPISFRGQGLSSTGARWVPERRQQVRVTAERCSGCQECIVRCPVGALSLDSRGWVAIADDSRCVACRQCERVCPHSAIEVIGPPRAGRRTPAGEVHLHGPTHRSLSHSAAPVSWLAAPPATAALAGSTQVAPEPSDPDRGLVGNRASTRPVLTSWDQVIVEAFRCLACPDPTCVRGCPAHIDIPGFVAALARRDARQAQEILSHATVLPDVCSRLCDQASLCEGACSWALAGEAPVSIGLLERFACDQVPVPPPRVPVPGAPGDVDLVGAVGDGQGEEHRSLEVVIIGSGPASIGAAWELVQGGAQVSVLERSSEPGGLLRWGIPAFVLPRELAARPWRVLQEAGVTVWCNVEATPDRLPGLRSRFDAVVMAQGAGVSRRRPFEGDQLDGIWDAARFLRAGSEAVATGKDLPTVLDRPRPAIRQPTVLVVGAGNTGLNVSRLAVRLGARAICIGRSDREATAVSPERIAVAGFEGVEFRFRTALVRADGDEGWVSSVVLVKTTPDGHPARGRRVSRGVRQVVDLVVVAQGSCPAPVWEGVLSGTPASRNPAGALEVDDPLPDWQACGLVAFDGVQQRGITETGARVSEQSLNRERIARRSLVPVRGRVWVVGDAFAGPATLVEAMAAGRRAAQEILRCGSDRNRDMDTGQPVGQELVPGPDPSGSGGPPSPQPAVPSPGRPGQALPPAPDGARGTVLGGDQDAQWSEIWAGAMQPVMEPNTSPGRGGRWPFRRTH